MPSCPRGPQRRHSETFYSLTGSHPYSAPREAVAKMDPCPSASHDHGTQASEAGMRLEGRGQDTSFTKGHRAKSSRVQQLVPANSAQGCRRLCPQETRTSLPVQCNTLHLKDAPAGAAALEGRKVGGAPVPGNLHPFFKTVRISLPLVIP